MAEDQVIEDIKQRLFRKPTKQAKQTHGIPIRLPGAAPSSSELGPPRGIKFTDRRGKRTGIDRRNFKAASRVRRPLAVALPTAEAVLEEA